MTTLTMSKAEPLAAPLAGHARTVALDDVSFRVTITKHTAPAASAPHRKPQRWTMATVTSLPDGAERFHGRIHAGTRPAEVLAIAGLSFECPSCHEVHGTWRKDEVLEVCTACVDSIVFGALELVEAR